METITRADALSKGLLQYFTGKPCKHGHISKRRVGSGSCIFCCNGWTRDWRKQNKDNGGHIPREFKTKELPSVDYLNECFDLVEGELIWKYRPQQHFKGIRSFKIFNKLCAGEVAGHRHKTNKYKEIRLDGKLYKGHRILYKMLTGVEPDGIVDHIDGDVTNDNISNLRVVTSQENSWNIKQRKGKRYKGVLPKGNKWQSIITYQDSATTSSWDTEEEAAREYDRMARLLFGEYAALNFPDDIVSVKDILKRMEINYE